MSPAGPPETRDKRGVEGLHAAGRSRQRNEDPPVAVAGESHVEDPGPGREASVRIPDRVPFAVAVSASLAALGLVGWIDFATGRLSVMLAYVFPIGVAAVFGGRKLAVVLAFLSTGVWLADYIHFYRGGGWGAAAWETGITLGMFLAFALIIAALMAARGRLDPATCRNGPCLENARFAA